jgi:hypothetical protein
LQTPAGAPSVPIPQNSRWQFVQYDRNNLVVLPLHAAQTTNRAREWVGPEREQVLTQILQLARVPTDRINFELRSEVFHAVEDAQFNHRIRNLKRRKEITATFRRISRIRNQVLELFDVLDDEVFKASRVERVSVLGLLAALFDIPLRYLTMSEPKKQVSNRPRGSTQNPILRKLIFQLYLSLERATGKLTLYQAEGEARGTLPAVLELLRPFLPDVIPVHLPYETLRDIRKSARKAQMRRLS